MALRVEIVMLGGLVGFVIFEARRRLLATTAGDAEANIFTDTVDEMAATITGAWPSGAEPYRILIEQAARQHDVPASMLAWLLWKESRYIPAVISGARRSPVGAMGIAQFMPATARELGIDPLNPNEAIPGAAKYLARLYRARGSWLEALAAYNWGIGNVQRKGIAAAPAETVDYYTTILNKSGYEAMA